MPMLMNGMTLSGGFIFTSDESSYPVTNTNTITYLGETFTLSQPMKVGYALNGQPFIVTDTAGAWTGVTTPSTVIDGYVAHGAMFDPRITEETSGGNFTGLQGLDEMLANGNRGTGALGSSGSIPWQSVNPSNILNIDPGANGAFNLAGKVGRLVKSIRVAAQTFNFNITSMTTTTVTTSSNFTSLGITAGFSFTVGTTTGNLIAGTTYWILQVVSSGNNSTFSVSSTPPDINLSITSQRMTLTASSTASAAVARKTGLGEFCLLEKVINVNLVPAVPPSGAICPIYDGLGGIEWLSTSNVNKDIFAGDGYVSGEDTYQTCTTASNSPGVGYLPGDTNWPTWIINGEKRRGLMPRRNLWASTGYARDFGGYWNRLISACHAVGTAGVEDDIFYRCLSLGAQLLENVKRGFNSRGGAGQNVGLKPMAVLAGMASSNSTNFALARTFEGNETHQAFWPTSAFSNINTGFPNGAGNGSNNRQPFLLDQHYYTSPPYSRASFFHGGQDLTAVNPTVDTDLYDSDIGVRYQNTSWSAAGIGLADCIRFRNGIGGLTGKDLILYTGTSVPDAGLISSNNPYSACIPAMLRYSALNDDIDPTGSFPSTYTAARTRTRTTLAAAIGSAAMTPDQVEPVLNQKNYLSSTALGFTWNYTNWDVPTPIKPITRVDHRYTIDGGRTFLYEYDIGQSGTKSTGIPYGINVGVQNRRWSADGYGPWSVNYPKVPIRFNVLGASSATNLLQVRGNFTSSFTITGVNGSTGVVTTSSNFGTLGIQAGMSFTVASNVGGLVTGTTYWIFNVVTSGANSTFTVSDTQYGSLKTLTTASAVSVSCSVQTNLTYYNIQPGTSFTMSDSAGGLGSGTTYWILSLTEGVDGFSYLTISDSEFGTTIFSLSDYTGSGSGTLAGVVTYPEVQVSRGIIRRTQTPAVGETTTCVQNPSIVYRPLTNWKGPYFEEISTTNTQINTLVFAGLGWWTGNVSATPTYQWFTSDTLNGTKTPIAGETKDRLLISSIYINKYISVGVTIGTTTAYSSDYYVATPVYPSFTATNVYDATYYLTQPQAASGPGAPFAQDTRKFTYVVRGRLLDGTDGRLSIICNLGDRTTGTSTNNNLLRITRLSGNNITVSALTEVSNRLGVAVTLTSAVTSITGNVITASTNFGTTGVQAGMSFTVASNVGGLVTGTTYWIRSIINSGANSTFTVSDTSNGAQRTLTDYTGTSVTMTISTSPIVATTLTTAGNLWRSGSEQTLMISVDLSDPNTANHKVDIWLDNTSIKNVASTTTRPVSIGLSATDRPFLFAALSETAGLMIDHRYTFFHTDYVDLNVQANRDKFTAAPANLSSTLGQRGQNVFNADPLVMLYGPTPGQSLGTKGNFSQVTPVLSILNTLSLSSTTFTAGNTSSGTINGATAGSTIAVSGAPSGFTINSAARTFNYTNPVIGTYVITLTETLSDRLNSPDVTTITLVVTA